MKKWKFEQNKIIRSNFTNIRGVRELKEYENCIDMKDIDKLDEYRNMI